MIQVLDGGLVTWRSSGSQMRLHPSVAIDTAPVTNPEPVLDVSGMPKEFAMRATLARHDAAKWEQPSATWVMATHISSGFIG